MTQRSTSSMGSIHHSDLRNDQSIVYSNIRCYFGFFSSVFLRALIDGLQNRKIFPHINKTNKCICKTWQVVLDDEQANTNAIRRLVRKLDRRLLPFLSLLEIVSVLNRASIGMLFSLELFVSNNIRSVHAAVMGIKIDLHMSDAESNWVTILYYIPRVRKSFSENLMYINTTYSSRSCLLCLAISFCALSVQHLIQY